ncbi:MAG: hypothetical protein M1822_005877 [Bathelium mastoideum]|nr:MAG: hypothetical protein M1822_005877 [Bathelium mastoideum]
MDVDGGESSPISTPPKSPMPGPPDSAAAHADSHPHRQSHDAKDGVAAGGRASDANNNPTTTATTTTTAAKARRPRKKKESNGDVKIEDVKDRKPRKAKASAPKKPKMADDDASATPAATRQTKLTEMVASNTQKSHPTEITLKAEVSTPASTPLLAATKGPPTPRPQSSGLNYDPIRGATTESVPHHNNISSGPPLTSPRLFNRASASPAISSLIDPPPAPLQSSTPAPHSTNIPTPNPPPSMSAPVSPTVMHIHQSPVVVPITSHIAPKAQLDGSSVPIAAEALKSSRPAGTATPDGSHPRSNASTPGPQPKPMRTQAPPLLPTGSGLLDPASLVPGTSGPGSSTGRNGTANGKAVDIDIHIPLKPSGGNTINIAQEITSRYGRDALNPRAAAHRDKLLRVAAAAGALEKGLALGGEGDDLMSLDISDPGGDDSNAEMGGMDDDGDGGLGKTLDGKPRKRKKKIEDYDKDDDFIDDTEMAWEQQAVAATEGFFVYSGPLKTDADKNESLTTSKTPPKRGRGSRGGRLPSSTSTRGGASTSTSSTNTTTTTTTFANSHPATSSTAHTSHNHPTTSTTHASHTSTTSTSNTTNHHPHPTNPTHSNHAAPPSGPSINPITGLPTSGRGSRGGRGARGGATVRKPRVTKADRAQMEREKAERERMGLGMSATLAAKTGGGSGAGSGAGSPVNGGVGQTPTPGGGGGGGGGMVMGQVQGGQQQQQQHGGGAGYQGGGGGASGGQGGSGGNALGQAASTAAG